MACQDNMNFQANTYQIQVDAGRQLWLSLTHLSRLRVWMCTKKDNEIFCTRILKYFTIVLDYNNWFNAPIIVSRNALREHMNIRPNFIKCTKKQKSLFIFRNLFIQVLIIMVREIILKKLYSHI